MAQKVEDYEEVRRRQVEDNKQKLEELKLSHLALGLRKVTAPKPPPVKRKPPREEFTAVKRKSNRIANLPPEVVPEKIAHRSQKSSGRMSKHRDLEKMAPKVEDYEEVRRRQVEDNKRRLEELKLGHIALALCKATAPKKPLSKQVKRKPLREEFTAVKRRSNRVANLPPEVVPEDIAYRKSSGSTSKHRDLDSLFYSSYEARLYAIVKAEELQAGLGDLYPTFVKPMLQSHTTRDFLLGLPNDFCNKHLRKKYESIYLIDEDGVESSMLYLRKYGRLGGGRLGAGWRGFSIEHELVDGDALVFQLINSTTFKVYIIRQSSYSGN